MRQHSLLIIFMVLLALSCKPTVPSEYIQPDDMADILYDYHVAQAMGFVKDGHSEQQFYFDGVLLKHGVSEARFDTSLVYYYSHADLLKQVYDQVNNRLAEEAKVLGVSVAGANRLSQYSTTGDTANVWPLPVSVLLAAQPALNRFDFSVKADTSYHAGDSFIFQFNTDYLWQNGVKDATACVVARYEGDSVTQTVQHVSGQNFVQLRVPPVNSHRLRELSGFIYLRTPDGNPSRRLLFVSQIQLIRIHHKNVDKDSERRDSLAPDSLQRSADAFRPLSDTARRLPVAPRLGDKRVPIKGGTGVHRVVPGAPDVRK